MTGYHPAVKAFPIRVTARVYYPVARIGNKYAMAAYDDKKKGKGIEQS